MERKKNADYRFAPPLRLGSFLIALWAPGAGAGADPIVNNDPPPPPPDVDGAKAIGALNGEEGC